jgi:hypothetical protein
MDPRNRVTRPTNARTEAAPQPSAERQYAQPVVKPSKKRPGKRQVFLVVGVLIILALLWGALSWFHIAGPLAGVKGDKYQAVFLTNDQVYFGKISDMNHDSITLKDVYYLKQDATAAKDQTSSKQVQLAKLGSGSEVHNPDNEMRINRDQVLFWENIKDDSQVVKTIKQAQ